MAELVTSSANPVVKRLRRLHQRKHREQERRAVVYGIQPVWQAVEAGAAVETLVVAPDLLRSPAALAMVADQERLGVPVVRMDADLFQRLSERDGPTGLAAIVSQRFQALEDLEIAADSVVLALDRLANPGNLGTILRTADATGAAAVVLVGPTTDPYDPAAIRGSMGAVFHVPMARAVSVDRFFTWADERGITVATTSARGRHALWSTPFPFPLAILLGGEGPGLADDDLTRGTLQISIPMVGAAESLNVAVAAGVLLYEIRRQRAAPR